MHWQRNTDSVLKRLSKKAAILLVLIGIPIMIFLFTFSLKKVTVEGTDRYTDKQIREMLLKTKLDYNSVLLYLKYNFIEKPEIPFIEKIDLELFSNHKVGISVYEKQIAGCVKFMGEYLYFDKDGIVVESSPERIKKIPVIDGLQFNEIILHRKLVVKEDSLYKVIMDMTNLINKYKLNVDVITFGKNYEITLLCNGIHVLIGKKDYYDEVLSDLKNILTKAKGTGLYELDMRDYVKGSNYVIGKSKNSSE